ncbi:MAG: Bug family tripartite tricarboxylate transporter substrate binding protein [Pigmentiphaga sp.]
MFPLKILLACVTLFGAPALAAAQAVDTSYPSKPIRLVVPYAPGGLTDSIGRLIAEGLSTELKQPVVVENRPGAGTMIGAKTVAAAAPDGHTLLLATSTTLAAAPSLYKDHVDPVTGFTPISLVVSNPFFLVTNATSGYQDVDDVVRNVVGQGEKGLSYGSAGLGSPHHLIMEMFREEAAINLVHVPYSGSGTAINGLFDGSFNIMITDLAPARGFIQEGRMKVLAVADDKRSEFLPNAPAFAEAGYPNVSLVAWQSVVGPANLPPVITARLSKALHKVVREPSFADRCEVLGCNAITSKSPEEFKEFIVSEQERWRKVLATAGMKQR